MPLLKRTDHRVELQQSASMPDAAATRRFEHAPPAPASGWLLRSTFANRLVDRCANPHCRTGWLHLWRSRHVPVFEQGWTCSVSCTRARLEAAVARETAGYTLNHACMHEPRMPLGLVLLSKGWITREELKEALEQQERAGRGSIGAWLREVAGISAATIAKGLAAQWNCAYLRPDAPGLEHVPALVPRILQRTHSLFPVRHIPSGVVYMVCDDRVEASVLAAIGRMLAARVEAAFMPVEPEEQKRRASNEGKATRLPGASPEQAASALCEIIERSRPQESRVVRVRDCMWLRTWGGRADHSAAEEGQTQDYVIDLTVPSPSFS